MNKKLYYLGLWLLLCSACQTTYLATTEIDYEQVSPQSSSDIDEEIEALISPYRTELRAIMDEVIGQLDVDLLKERPECNMGNWLADMMYEEAKLLNDGVLDFAVQNHGGLRVPSMGAGPITRGEVIEVMPFDNKLAILSGNAVDVQAFLDHIAAGRGWPISSNLEFKIKDDKAIDIKINGKPLDSNKTYHFALPDYIAGGGSGTDMLKGLQRKDFSVLLRDCFVQNIIKDTKAGISQNPIKEGRIINLDDE